MLFNFNAPSKTAFRTGWTFTILIVLFMLIDSGMKIAQSQAILEACAPLQIPAWTIPRIGLLALVATILYAIPQTALVGAVMLTGYLGGATWTHLRLGEPIFPIFFPSIFTALVWLALYLREPRLRALMPIRQTPRSIL